MVPVSISKPEHSIEDGWHVASVSITIKGKTYRIQHKASHGPLARSSEPFLAATLLLAMNVGKPMQVHGTVSPKLLGGTQTVQDIFTKWFPEFKKILLQACPGLSDEVNKAGEVGAFFSGGVDSFYTLLKHQDEITKIILIHDYGVALVNASHRSRVAKQIHQVAQDFDKPLIEVETNIRELRELYAEFVDHYTGFLLPSIGLLLSPQFEKIYIPSSYSYDHLIHSCWHPLLDPLWSTESLEFVHDGCEASRVEKIALIAQSDTALRSLRVCFENADDSYNCGRCEKCLRTMVGLQAFGALERCPTFPHKLDIEAILRMRLYESAINFAEENLRALENSGNAPDLTEALRSCIQRNKYEQFSNLLNKNLREFLASTQGAKFVSGKKNTIFKSLWQNEEAWLLREVFKEKLKELDQKFLFGMVRRLCDIQKGGIKYGSSINK